MPEEHPKKPSSTDDPAKKLLLKKRTDASARKVPLAPSELVDDALARGGAAGVRWLKKNIATIQWVVLAAVAGGAGAVYFASRTEGKAEAATAELLSGIEKERGKIREGEAAKSDDEKVIDKAPFFKSVPERREAALQSYRAVAQKYSGSGPAILARLAEAGALLDAKDWDGALAAYREVRASKLASADVDVRGRSLEGIGFCAEAKGDIDGALKAFRELENTDAKGLKELGMYHQARLMLAKDGPDKDKGKELLKGAYEKLTASKSDSPLAQPSFLQSQVEDLLRRVDPTALPDKNMERPGSKMTLEQFQQMQEQMQRMKGSSGSLSKPPGAP